MSEFNLPEAWVKTQLGEYLHLKNGYAFKSNSYVAKGNDTVPVIRISDIDGKLATDETAIHVKKADVVGGFEIKKGDLLIAMSGATTGKVGVYNGSEPAYQNQRVGNLKLHSDVFGSVKYKDHLIASLTPEILKVAYGGAQPNISGKAIEEFLVALPPLAEQQQIAQKLDELLAQVDTLKTRLDAIPKILKRFRQSVLAAAVSGRLTEGWRGSDSNKQDVDGLKNEKEILIKKKEIKNDLLVKPAEQWFEIPEGWSFLELQSFAVKITDGEHQTPKRESSGHYLLSARNVRDGAIDLTKVDYVGAEEFHKLRKRCDPNKGDILISCSGSVGRIALVDKDDEYVMVRSAALVKTLPNYINNVFLMFVLQSHFLQKQIEEKSKSTAQSNLFLGQIKELGIPFPSLEEQTEIVRRVEQLFAYADQIEQRVKDAQARVNHLTQSILAKAFRGELTAEWRAQNPDLISGENSAAALLERIKAEREANAKPKRKVKA